MTPFYFGVAKRKLFGVLDPAQGKSGKPQAAVICYPWGHEYVYAHRALRHLSLQLADGGFHVLRFDYYGTGDSAGDDFEGQLSGWRQDIAAAIEELKESCGARSVALVGLRLGAALAAEVAVGRQDIAALVLWDPAVSGPEHLEGLDAEWKEMALRHNRRLGGEGQDRRGGLYGLPISDDWVREFDAIDLLKVTSRMPSRTLCLSTEQLASHDKFRLELERHPSGPLNLEEIADIRPWVEPDIASLGALPVVAIGRIVAWLAT
jgi:uncharacterized protein